MSNSNKKSIVENNEETQKYCQVLSEIYANNSKQLLLWLVQVYLTVPMKLSDYAKKKGINYWTYTIHKY